MGRPSYNPVDTKKEILLTLLLLDNGSFGRYTLSKYLGLTKAKTRTVLEHLNELDLASSSKGRGGTQLTNKGRNLVKKIRDHCYLDWNLEVVDLPDNFIDEQLEQGIIFFAAENFNSNGLYERDIAVRQGANGAITLLRMENNWIFPNDDSMVERVNILDDEKVHPYNVLIITFGPDLGGVYSAISAILLYHLDDELDELLEPTLNS